MFRMLLFVSAASAAVLMLVRKAPRGRTAMGLPPSLEERSSVVPAREAAERLRQAWGIYHTVA